MSNNPTDSELFAQLLTTCGGSTEKAKKQADSICGLYRLHGSTLRAHHLAEVEGLGLLETQRIIAATELVRRHSVRSAPRISLPQDVYSLVRHCALKKQEQFISISLNGAHDVIALRTVTMGLVNRSQIHPREVFADIIVDRACALIVAHNHPSNNLTPSNADRSLTKRIVQTGEILGIPVLDHIIFGAHDFISLKEQEGDLFETKI
jgi:DNA repair protein RadC